ncbi:MAG: pantetheine-phosphate adenylyltransferase [Clostridia bacterium]|jgi:pantetheine-phosphate adenylyltransferase|nr:pantetheine-phosphate adenylyltransferase [Clostridia bacterium]
MRVAVYPGTFDPITNGHLDIVERAAGIFDRVIIAIANENYKKNLFTLEERRDLVIKVCKHIPNIQVEVFQGLLADFVQQKKAYIIIRGLRAVSDFEYEFQMSVMNKKLNKNIETVFLTAANEYTFLSSSIIKQVASLGGSVNGLVPPVIEQALKDKFAERRKRS